MTYPLSYLNENSLNCYPLTKSFGTDDAIVDACFKQFDGFIPILQSIVINQTSVILQILTDAGLQEVIATTPFTPATYNLSDGSRWLGKITLDKGITTIWSAFSNTTISMQIPFAATAVKPIASQGGMYSFNGFNGNVSLTTDNQVFFTTTGTDVVFNSVGIPDSITQQIVKTINGISPTYNGIQLNDSDMIKFTSNKSTLTVSAIGDTNYLTQSTLVNRSA